MTFAHLLLVTLAATGFVIATWLLQEAGRVARASGDAVGRLALFVVPMATLLLVALGTLVVREALVSLDR